MSKIFETFPGNTFFITWVSTSVNSAFVDFQIVTGSETIINTGTMSNCGGGTYIGKYTSSETPGYYTVKTTADISSSPYVGWKRFRVVKLEVD